MASGEGLLAGNFTSLGPLLKSKDRLSSMRYYLLLFRVVYHVLPTCRERI